jgi:hypothetical protein
MQTGTLEITGLPVETLKTLADKAREAGATAEEYARTLIERGLAFEARLSEEDERLESIEGIRDGLESMRQGKGTYAREFFAELRKEFGIPESRK